MRASLYYMIKNSLTRFLQEVLNLKINFIQSFFIWKILRKQQNFILFLDFSRIH